MVDQTIKQTVIGTWSKAIQNAIRSLLELGHGDSLFITELCDMVFSIHLNTTQAIFIFFNVVISAHNTAADLIHQLLRHTYSTPPKASAACTIGDQQMYT